MWCVVVCSASVVVLTVTCVQPAEPTASDPNDWQFNGRYWAMRDVRLAALNAKVKNDSGESKGDAKQDNSEANKTKKVHKAKKDAPAVDGDDNADDGETSGGDDKGEASKRKKKKVKTPRSKK